MPKKNLMSQKGNENIDEVFEKFINYSESKNLSSETIKYYKNNYKRFKQFLENYDIEYVDQIDLEIIKKYRIMLLNKHDNNTTVNTYLRAIRSFLYYAMELNYLENFKIKMVKTDKKVKKTYTNAELEKLLEKPNLKECGFATYRNWVIINWLLSTGNRASTIRNIKIKDLDFENGYVTLRKVKNRKQRIIPLSKSLINILQEYLQYRDGEEDDYLFCTIYGEKLSDEGLGSAIPRYNKRRGVNKTSIHLFRHTFAKLWIKNGGDIFRLQKILGHSDMEMVKEYVNMYGEDLKEDFEKFNPINQFNTGSKDPIQID